MLQEYHQDIISAVWMVILSLYAEDPVWAGAILLSFLICVHVGPRIEYHQAMILVGWMILLSLSPDRDPRLRDLRTMRTLQPIMLSVYYQNIISVVWMIVLQDHDQDIISAVWMIILSLYQDGSNSHWVFRLSFLICVHVMRPRIEYHHASILVGWMILLCLIPHRGLGLRDVRTRSILQPYMLQEHHQGIISAAWMIMLSLYREEPVWAGAILLSFLIWVHAMRSRIEHHQGIIRVGWIILLSLISGLVRARTIFLICVHAMGLFLILGVRTSNLVLVWQDAFDNGIMR